MSKLIIVSNRLPLTVETIQDKPVFRQSSGGLISAVTAYLNIGGRDKFSQVVWAGVPGCSERVWESLMHTQEEVDYLYKPVFLNRKTYELYYNGFSNSLLWPLFHYFPSFADYNETYFASYMNANREFAEALMNTIKEDDTVWIHDYHLLPLAGMLRKFFPKVTIGFFLHIPFPSYEIFRVVPKQWQRAILEGVLGADLVGFHTSDYVTHFLMCVKKVMKLEVDGQNISYYSRQVKVAAFPIGIDYNQFNDAYDDPEVVGIRKRYQEVAQGKKFIFSVDRLDYTKGVSNRLRAYERFLQENPEYRGKVTFALNIVPSRDSILKYAERKKMIDEYIGSLNSRLGSIEWQPILYQYAHLSFSELVALYTGCDLALITPLRDGMNLVCKEFVASRKDKRGVLVLSEFAGASEELEDALLINPNDTAEIAQMIKDGLDMSVDEQTTRMERMQERVRSYDVTKWANDFFEHLESGKNNRLEFEVSFINSFTKIDIADKYSSATKRLLLLDYDGTLVPFHAQPHLAIPSDEVITTLNRLAEDEGNDVYIISGRDRSTLTKWLGHLPVGLVSEHGAIVKHKGGNWQNSRVENVDDWMRDIESLMGKYTSLLPQSFIEKKDYGIAWHYRNVVAANTSDKTRQLYEELQKYAFKKGLVVLNGHKVIEVKSSVFDKGTITRALLGRKDYDFIMAIGDDVTDEAMFKELATINSAFTIKVGGAASFAKYNLHNPNTVLGLLHAISTYRPALQHAAVH